MYLSHAFNSTTININLELETINDRTVVNSRKLSVISQLFGSTSTIRSARKVVRYCEILISKSFVLHFSKAFHALSSPTT